METKKGLFTATIRYWPDRGMLVGQIKEMPAVVSQGKDFPDLLLNLADAAKVIQEHGKEKPA